MLFKTVLALVVAAASASAAVINRSSHKTKCEKVNDIFITANVQDKRVPFSLEKADVVFNSKGKHPLKIVFQVCGSGDDGSDGAVDAVFGRLYLPSKKDCVVPTHDRTLEISKCKDSDGAAWKISGSNFDELTYVGKVAGDCDEWGYSAGKDGSPNLGKGSKVVLKCIGNGKDALPFIVEDQ